MLLYRRYDCNVTLCTKVSLPKKQESEPKVNFKVKKKVNLQSEATKKVNSQSEWTETKVTHTLSCTLSLVR